MKRVLALPLCLALCGCVGGQDLARDALWPFGNPNAPDNSSENAERALGRSPDVAPIAPQAGNIWPGPVQPVPTIADIERNANQPLGQGYMPSTPPPYPPAEAPPAEAPPAGAPLPSAGNTPNDGAGLVPGNPHGAE